MTPARRLTLALGFTQTIGHATSYYVPSVLNAAVSESLGVSRTALLAEFTLALLVYGLASPGVGLDVVMLVLGLAALGCLLMLRRSVRT